MQGLEIKENRLTKKGNSKASKHAAQTPQAEVSHDTVKSGGESSKHSTAQVTYSKVNQGKAQRLP